jgi:ubiquinone biosynthesis protein UbiJ
MTRFAALALERVLNGAVRLDPELGERFQTFAGRVLAVELKDTRIRITLGCDGNGAWRAQTDPGRTPDLLVRGPLPALLAAPALVRSNASLDAYHRLGIEFEGDLEIARRLQQTLMSYTFDWEELLSRLMGDLAAHQLAGGLRAVAGASSAARDTMARNIGEQLQYGLSLLPARAETEAFLRDVDQLRSDVDRLTERLRCLAENPHAPG